MPKIIDVRNVEKDNINEPIKYSFDASGDAVYVAGHHLMFVNMANGLETILIRYVNLNESDIENFIKAVRMAVKSETE